MAKKPHDTSPEFPPDDSPDQPPADQSPEETAFDDLDLAQFPDDPLLTEAEGVLSAVPTDPDPDIPNLPDAPGAELTVPDALPASDPGLTADFDNLEPVSPIAPAADWVDDGPTEFDLNAYQPAPPLSVEPADPDPFSAPPYPTIEGSDIFGAPGAPRADRAESSDVIAATAYGEATEAGDSGGGSGDLPVAEEVPDESAGGATLFDEDQLARVPELPDVPSAPGRHDAPDFGASPGFTPDASSILADLSDPDTSAPGDSSAVPLAAPGGGRSFPSDPSVGSEFDLSVSSGAVPPELAEAELEAESEPSDWKRQPSSDLHSGRHSSSELNLDFVASDASSAEVVLPPEGSAEEPSFTSSPSSIFSGEAPPPGTGGRPEDSDRVSLDVSSPKGESDSDSAVEFSDHPLAEDEASASRIFAPSNPSSRVTRPAKTPPEPEYEPSSPGAARTNLPDDGVIDWDLAAEPDDSTVGLPGAGKPSPAHAGPRGEKNDAPTLPDGRSAPPHVPPAPPKVAPKPGSVASTPSVEIDWMASPADDSVAENEGIGLVPAAAPRKQEEPARGAKKPAARDKARAPKREAERPAPAERPAAEHAETRRGGKGGWVGGTVLGMVLAGGAFAGAYFGGLLPNGEGNTKSPANQPVAQNPNSNAGGSGTNPGAGGAAPTLADVVAAVRAGDPARAKQIAATLKDETPAGKAAAGEAQLFALVQDQKGDSPIAADNPDLKAAREGLQALVDDAEAAKTPEGERAAVKAAVQLGVSHELAGDAAAARKVYQDAAKKFPAFASTFEAALHRLASTAAAPPGPKGEGSSRRLDPADARQLLLAVTLLQADGKADDAEAGVFFWKAVNRAAAESYTEAVEEIKKAKAAHVKQAKANAGRGLNPLSDPLEQIFPRCCADLQAYWELKAAVYSQKPIAELVKDVGAAKAMAALADARKQAAESMTLATKYKEAADKLVVAGDKLNEAMKAFETAEKALKEEKALVTNLRKDADDMKVAFEKKLQDQDKLRTTLQKQLDDVTGMRNTSASLIESVAREMQRVKLLPAKFDTKDTKALLDAVKSAAENATGPNLAVLLPRPMVAAAGGLSAAQLVGIANRMTKAETAVKAAEQKYAADLKRQTDSHIAFVKKMNEDYNANMKSVTDTNATNMKLLRDAHAAALKKQSDKYAAEAKKLSDDFQAKVKEAEQLAVKERERAEAMAAQFKKDLGNAVSPAQALDIWLPLLVELRRPADAAPALATAEKVIASAPADSEDAGKARTVAGLAHLFKNELPAAKLQFQSALTNPTHPAALKEKKLWAVAAELGLASVADPLAPYRLPVETPRRDPVLAARHLDAGVKAYRDRRYEDAVAALTDSTKADPTDPVAWYFLGAARWQTGAADLAKDAYRQGAVREAASNLTARAIGEALTPIQGPARAALDTARP